MECEADKTERDGSCSRKRFGDVFLALCFHTEFSPAAQHYFITTSAGKQ